MKFGSKILRLLLIGVLVAAPLATNAWGETGHAGASSAAPTRGVELQGACHTHAGKPFPHLPTSPLPAPINYRCCVTGHDVAVVQAAQFPQPSTDYTRVTLRLDPDSICWLGGMDVSTVLFVDPPGTTPLRL